MIDNFKIYSILARDSKNHIAKYDELPWKNDSTTSWDMDSFKRITTGNIIYMGYNTSLTLKNPLPNRVNVIEDRNIEESDDLFIHTLSLENFLAQNRQKFENEWKEKKLFLIGGAKLIRKYAYYIDDFYLTTFTNNYEGDIFFDESILESFSERKTIESHQNGIIELFRKRD